MKRSLNIFAVGVLALASFQNVVAMDEASWWEAPVQRTENLKKNIIAAVVMMQIQEKVSTLILALENGPHAQDRRIAAQLKQAMPDLMTVVPDIEHSSCGGEFARTMLEQFDAVYALVNKGIEGCSDQYKSALEAMKRFLEFVKTD